MKRIASVLLILALLFSVALAENVDAVNTYVSRQGYKPITAKNRSRISGCWFSEDSAGDTLQWSDKTTTYSITSKPGRGLRSLYGQLIGMSEWDTATYTIDGKTQFSFNAPEIDSVKSYKTLKNYIKYVTAFIDENEDIPVAQASTGRQSYIINKSSKKFHRSDCSYVSNMKKANKEKFTGSRDELIDLGYEPCKHCNP